MKLVFIILIWVTNLNSSSAQSKLDWQKTIDFYTRETCGKSSDVSLRKMVQNPLELLGYDERMDLLKRSFAAEKDIEFVIHMRADGFGVIDSVWIVSPDEEKPAWHTAIVNAIAASETKWPSCYFSANFEEEKWVIILPFSYFVADESTRRHLPPSEALYRLVYDSTKSYLSITAPITRSYTAVVP